MSHNSATTDRESLKARFHSVESQSVGQSRVHESAAKHVTGEAQYIDDKACLAGTLHLAPRLSDHARATILSVDVSRCYQVPGSYGSLRIRIFPASTMSGLWKRGILCWLTVKSSMRVR